MSHNFIDFIRGILEYKNVFLDNKDLRVEVLLKDGSSFKYKIAKGIKKDLHIVETAKIVLDGKEYTSIGGTESSVSSFVDDILSQANVTNIKFVYDYSNL
jgi:hypothetical protein